MLYLRVINQLYPTTIYLGNEKLKKTCNGSNYKEL